MSTATSDPQTYWKRIKVPPELRAAGWELVKRDSTAPFAMVNEKLDQDTGGFPDPQEAISAAQGRAIELEEAAAIASEGALTNGARPTVLPLNLVDEGWKLRYERGAEPRSIFAKRGELRTAAHADPADTVAEAIKLETERQAEIERNENADGEVVITRGEVADFVARGQAAQTAVDEFNGHGHGNQETPAEIMLELERIRTDGGTQQRSLFDETVVADYREVMEAGDQFPAVDVFFDGAEYWLADGFYRLEARRTLGQAAIAAHVRQGTQRDAILFSLGANARHGLRRTPEDKRRAVLVMLRDPEWAAWSDAYIAERVRVSVPTVRKLRHQEEAAQETPPTASKRRGRDGRVQDTSRIGKGKQTADPTLPLAGAAPPEASAPTAKKKKQAPNAASARIELCSDCDKELTAGDYRNDLGQCWDCAGMGKKKTAQHKSIADSAASTERQKSATATPPTFAELGQGRDLKLSLYCLRSQPGRAFVSVLIDKHGADLHECNAAEVELGATLTALIVAQLKRTPAARPPRKATKKAAAKKPARRAVKAVAAPARKTTVKTSGKLKLARGSRGPTSKASKKPLRKKPVLKAKGKTKSR